MRWSRWRREELGGTNLSFLERRVPREGKALPFGVGVVVGSTANYALTKYVGNAAKRWFEIDRDGPDHQDG